MAKQSYLSMKIDGASSALIASDFNELTTAAKNLAIHIGAVAGFGTSLLDRGCVRHRDLPCFFHPPLHFRFHCLFPHPQPTFSPVAAPDYIASFQNRVKLLRFRGQ
ncbi:hypothetical protein LINPERPRIM_LOCUS29102 [Linum perenne]